MVVSRSHLKSLHLVLFGVALILAGLFLIGWQVVQEYEVWHYVLPKMRQGWGSYVTQQSFATLPFPVGCSLNEQCRPNLLLALAQQREFWGWWWVVGLVGFVTGLGLVKVGATREDEPVHNAHFLTPREARQYNVFIDSKKSTPLEPQLALAKFRSKPIGVKSFSSGKHRVRLPHGALIASTQSGKTLLAKHTALTFPGSMVIVDIKGELYRETAGFRALLGPVYVLDAAGGTGHLYDPVSDVQTSDHDLGVLAEVLVQHNEDHLASADFTRRATAAVKAALYAARAEGRAPIPYLLEVTEGGLETFVKSLAALEPAATPGPIRAGLTAFLSKPPELVDPKTYEETRGYLPVSWSIITGHLEVFRDHAAMLSHSDFSARDLAKRPTTVYIIWPTKLLGDKSSIPLQVILSTLINTLTDDANRLDKEAVDKRVQTLLLLDELPQYAFSTLPQQIAVARSAKVAAMLVCQSFEQLGNAFGHKNANTLLDNCDYKVILRPDGEVARWLETELGRVSVKRRNVSRSRGRHGHTETRSEGEVVRPLETYEELRLAAADTAYVLMRGVSPVKGVKLAPYLDHDLKKREQISPPALKPYAIIHRKDSHETVKEPAQPEIHFVDPDEPNEQAF